jgi:ligand-binding sensor domain-containing protein/two-component sensor histidine kinase
VKIVITIFIVFVYLSKTSLAQDPIAFQITTEEGLPNQTIYSVVQDQKGFIWLGTDAGLYRYDGVRYKEYKSPYQKSRSVTGLTLAQNGRLYMYNFNGQIFYIEKDSLFFLSSWNNGIISNICTDTVNQLWVAHDRGIVVLNNKTNKWTNYSTNCDNNNSGFTHSCFIEKDNTLWCIGSQGLVAIKNNRKTFFSVKWKEGKVSGEYQLAYNSKDKFVFSRVGGEIFKLVNGHIKSFYSKNLNPLLQDKKITRAEEDADGRIWIFTFSGIVIYDIKKDISEIYYGDKCFSSGICDNENTYWLATLDDGLLRIPEINHKIWQVKDSKNNNIKISKLKCSDKHIAFSSSNGIVGTLDFKSNLSQLISLDTKLDIQSLALTESKKDVLFSIQNSIYKTNQKSYTEVIKSFPPTKDLLQIGNHYIIATSRGAYWINGNDIKQSQTLNGLWCRSVVVNKEKNKLYIATNKGIDIFYKNNINWIKINTLLKDVQITSLHVSETNDVYSLSYNGSIHQIEKDKETKLLVTLPEYINAHQIIVKKNKLYGATNKGLYVFNLKGQLLQIVNRLSGLASDNINALDIDSNYIWLASSKGIEQIPLTLNEKTSLSKIYLNSISINNILQEFDEHLSLKYKQGFSVKLEAVSLSSENQFQYAYRLNKANWLYLPATISDINIPPLNSGAFKLDIKLVNHLGNDSLNTITIKGYVAPPFWQTWWFYILIGCVFVFIATIVFKNRIKRLERKQAKELERIHIEHQLKLSQETALRAQMNPHFIFNVLNSIKSYIYENDKKKAASYLQRFSDLVRKILEQSSMSWVKLDEEIELLKLYIELESMLFIDEFHYSIQIDDSIDISHTSLPSLILQPFIENAFKHGLRHKNGEKNLEIAFAMDEANSTLIVTISDNGIGRDQSKLINDNNSKKHQSFSTEAINKVKTLNQNQSGIIAIDYVDLFNNYQSIGTSVVIKIKSND